MKSWKEKRNYLCQLIKQVSDENGGDNIEWLREYAKDIIKTYNNDIDKAIECFECLCTDNLKSSNLDEKNSLKNNVCEKCGYVSPICRFDLYKKCSNIDKVS